MRLVCLVTLIMLAAALAAPTLADTTDIAPDTTAQADSALAPAPDTAAYEVTIGRLLVDNMQLDDTLDITLDTHGRELGAFDLKIGIDNPAVSIVQVLPGELQDSCGWEYFNARSIKVYDRSDYPSELWQIVALAQTIPGPKGPTCFELPGEVVLFRLVLSNDHLLQTPDQAVAIFFFWEDCTDNTIAGKSGNTLMMSRHVYDYFGGADSVTAGLFPTRTGAPAECIKPNVVNPMRRLVDFHDGGVEFKLNVENVRAIDSSEATPEK